MSHTSGKFKDFKYYCKYCEQQILYDDLRSHIVFEVQNMSPDRLIKDNFNQYCKTCDVRQNKEIL